MERKHQVFVSSTFKDLVEERQHVIHALLELDCIPAGMELFPAADEDAWTLIKEVIDNSDYYLLIIAGKYGSMNSDGISYTEMEFDYAIKTNKPTITFLHKDIETLTGNKIEKTEDLQNRLNAFREKAQNKHCKFWSNAEDLGGKVSRSLVQLRKNHPSDGWIPGRFATDENLYRKIEEYRNQILELEKKISTEISPSSSKELAQGDEKYSYNNFFFKNSKLHETKKLETTWDNLFSYAGSAMTGECTEHVFQDKIRLAFWHTIINEVGNEYNFKDILIPQVRFDDIKVQLQALGLIERGAKKRAVSDTNTYWKLTSFGEKHLLKVRAIKSSKIGIE